MSIVIDLIILAIILICAIISAKYGFTRTVIELVGFIAILIFVNSVSTPIAEKIYDLKIEPSIISAVQKDSNDGTENITDNVWDAIPKLIRSNSSVSKYKDKFIDTIDKNVSNGIQTAAVKASDKIVKPTAIKIISLIVSILLFTVLNILVKFIAKLLDKIVKHSFAKGLNRRLGFIIGIPKGIIISLVFCLILIFVVDTTKNGIWIFNEKSVNNSYVIILVRDFLPKTGIFSFLKF